MDIAHSTIDTDAMKWDFKEIRGILSSSILVLLNARKVNKRGRRGADVGMGCCCTAEMREVSKPVK